MRDFIAVGYSDADNFNPALIRWQDRTLMMYRCRVRGQRLSELFIGEVDGDLRPIGNFRKVNIPLGFPSHGDPRFFIFKDQLHFSFLALKKRFQRTGIGIITDDLQARDCRLLGHPDGQIFEKNWIFFQHGDDLYCTYSMAAGVHQVCRVAGEMCEPCFETTYLSPWTRGHPRGGTQLIAHEGLWYGFFHGSISPDGELWKRYFMGAYAISPEPPFPIVRMSHSPLFTPVGAELCGKSDHSKGELMAVVFPSGLILRDGNWLVAAGYNDHSIMGFEISHGEIESNLVSTMLPDDSAGPQADARPASKQDRIWNVHFPMDDFHWMNVLEVARKHIGADEAVFAHGTFLPCFPNARPYESVDEENLRSARWIILHKDHTEIIGFKNMLLIKSGFDVIFADEVFALLAGRELGVAKTHFDPIHAEALWEQLDWLEDDPLWQNTDTVHSDSVITVREHPVPAGFAVAIMTLNALEYTQRCLASLEKFATGPYHVFIVDNFSIDGTREWLAQQTAPNLHYTLNTENLGAPCGRNRLIEMMLPFLSENGFAVIGDNDIEMTGLWQDPFVEFFKNHPEVGIAGKTGYRITVHEDSRELLPTPGVRPMPVDVLTGFAWWVRAAVLKQVGGYDEALGLFCHSDDDYCVQALAAGWEVFGVPRAPVIHHGHKSGAAYSPWYNDLSSKNQRYLAGKWREMDAVDGRGRIVHTRCVWFPYMNNFPKDDPYWAQVLEAAQASIKPVDSVFASECFRKFFPQTLSYALLAADGIPKVDWIIFHKDCARDISPKIMESIKSGFHAMFANEVFVLLAKGAGQPQAPVFSFNPVHVEALWAMCS